ncbi:hypothetical protein QBC47DRAFT_404219 [Echria macrotheca]|uniref:DUF7702 domain-containing protein n=1 Tax=Echria macrotheca TaxID=438768 RepID=A0AAJ0F411_9PEZI|nr:hypothetical protein QBC47DRAFT_404219 [Echria macrotheca]
MDKARITPPTGPPYPPPSAPLGGVPTPIPDIPICAVLITLFTIAGFGHLLFLRRHILSPPTNRDRPLPPLILTIFCLLRITALSLRIAWSAHPGNINLSIASTEFTSAGLALLIILNLILARRMVRDYTAIRPSIPLRTCRALMFCVVACLAMVISASVDAFFSRDADNLQTGRNVIRVSLVILAVLAAVPSVAVLAVWMWGEARQGIARRGALILGVSMLLTLEVGFRCGNAFAAKRVEDPGWINSKACYYCFVFLIETVIVYALLVARLVNGMY